MAATKFLFDTSFDPDDRRSPARAPECAPEPVVEEPAPPPDPTFSAAELAAARTEGEAQGRVAALDEAKASDERAAAQALELVAQQLDGLLQGWQTVTEEHQGQCLRLSLAILRKVFSRLSAINGMSEIEQVITDCLARLQEEPRIVVRVADDLLDSLQSRIEPLTQRSGFEGKIVLIADDSLTPGAVRVEWADGGAERDPESSWAAIEALIEEAIPQTQAPQAQAPSDQSSETKSPAPRSTEPETPQPAPAQPAAAPLNPEGQPPQPADRLAAQA